MPTIMKQMNAISRAQSVFRGEALNNGELGGCHHSFVLAICYNPGMSQEQLARHICLNKSTVARTLTYLEEKGYVIRRPSEADKRITLVYPTAKMEEVLPRLQKQEIRPLTLDTDQILCLPVRTESQESL